MGSCRCPSLTIVSMSEEHLGDVWRVEAASFREPFPPSYLRLLYALSGGYSLVALCEERVTGFIIGVPLGDAIHIADVAVEPGCRGLRIGSALLASLEHLAEEDGFRLVFLETWVSNRAARGLYEAHGYRPVGFVPRYYPWGEAAVVYVKLLGGGRWCYPGRLAL